MKKEKQRTKRLSPDQLILVCMTERPVELDFDSYKQAIKIGKKLQRKVTYKEPTQYFVKFLKNIKA